MLSTVKDSLDITLSLVALAGIIWHVANTKAEIEKSIDKVKDELLDKITDLSTQNLVSKARHQGKTEVVEYYINDIYYQIHHTRYRVGSDIKDIQNFLQKDGFVARSRYAEEPPPAKKIKIEEI